MIILHYVRVAVQENEKFPSEKEIKRRCLIPVNSTTHGEFFVFVGKDVGAGQGVVTCAESFHRQESKRVGRVHPFISSLKNNVLNTCLVLCMDPALGAQNAGRNGYPHG